MMFSGTILVRFFVRCPNLAIFCMQSILSVIKVKISSDWVPHVQSPLHQFHEHARGQSIGQPCPRVFDTQTRPH